MTETQGFRLPENAKTPLKPGEVYQPLVPSGATLPEITIRSVVTGLVMTVLFSLVAAYLALKVGQGIEAAIPISILAIGMGKLFTRKSTILENVIIQSIGANSSHVVAGAVFTIPALYMLGIPPTWYTTALTAFLGGSYGILFFTPLRHYFMAEQHGLLPWPEATATTEILVSSEAAGGQALVLVISTLLGGIYEFCGQTLHAFKDLIDFKSVPIPFLHGAQGKLATIGGFLESHFMTMRISNLAAVTGVGYIIGLKYAAIICAGSFVSYFVLVPLVHAFAPYAHQIIPPGTKYLSAMSIDQVFTSYVRMIGIGGIAGAGVIGIIAAFPSMMRSIAFGMKGLGHHGEEGGGVPRIMRSLTMKEVGLGLVILSVAAFLFFFGILGTSFAQALVGLAIVLVIAFLFAPVAARAIALVGTNPVSGMTLMTLIITSLVFLSIGLTGPKGMTVALIVGGVVCTALAASGALSSDLKIGYWIGATPRNQLLWKFVGTGAAALSCALAMWLLSRAYNFGSTEFPAPQASAMKEIIEGIMGKNPEQGIRWVLFGSGILFALILRMVGVPALAFALGMYLPIQLNVPVMIGGFVAWLVGRERKGEAPKATKAGHDKGILIASGLIAGGGLVGILDAVLASWPSSVLVVDWKNGICPLSGNGYPLFESVKKQLFLLRGDQMKTLGEWISIGAMFLLCLFIYTYARTGRKNQLEPIVEERAGEEV